MPKKLAGKQKSAICKIANDTLNNLNTMDFHLETLKLS